MSEQITHTMRVAKIVNLDQIFHFVDEEKDLKLVQKYYQNIADLKNIYNIFELFIQESEVLKQGDTFEVLFIK